MFGMDPLQQALDELERQDPRVKAARIRLDETIDSLVLRASIQDEIDKNKRQAVLDLLESRYAARDQEGVNSTIMAAMFRGYELSEDDLLGLLAKCDPETQEWWMADCGPDCTLDHDIHLMHSSTMHGS